MDHNPQTAAETTAGPAPEPAGPAVEEPPPEGLRSNAGPRSTEAAPRVWVVNPSRAGLVGWLFRYLAFTLVALVWAAVLVGVGAYRTFATGLPEVEAIERYASLAPGVTRIYAANGAMLAEVAREHRAYAPYEEIPAPLVQAFLAAEDRRFFTHGGLDVRGLGRALLANLRSGTIEQGGSTITQQVAKGFLTQDQTLARKLREAILSVRMESRIPKERILEVYLNKIFLGHGAYGVAAAASRYFDKPLRELTLAECALIAGLARAPTRYSPQSSLERARERRAVVLQDMVEAGYIDAAARDAADAEPIVLAGEAPDPFRARAPYYAEHVRQTVTAALGEEALLTEGLQIETPVELPLQARASLELDESLRRLDTKQGFRGPVAHLPDEAARQELLGRLVAEYGPTPLEPVASPGPAPSEPADAVRRERADPPPPWRLALVTKVNRFNAWVSVGTVAAIIPLRSMRWASRYDRNSGVNDVQLTDVREALEEGDVVWVQRVADPRGAPPDPEQPALPVVKLGQLPRVEAALYTADHQTGYVVTMAGGRDYDRSQYNRATQACRQPGSVFKAIYYGLALDTSEYAMDTMLEDKPYEPEPGEEWKPENLHGTLAGAILLRNAFIHSLNLPSIRLFQKLGARAVVAWSRRLGFSTELIADKALSLGASCVRMDELSRAFGIYVRGGRSWEPRTVRRVTNRRGQVVLDHRHPWDEAMDVAGRLDAMARLATTDAPVQRVDDRTAFLITRMMRDVVTHGIGRAASRIGVPAGGKSGTASKKQNTTDTWFVGFTARFVTAAWMGDDDYERSMGDEEASYTTATPLWTHFMKAVVEGIPHPDALPAHRPPGVTQRTVEFEAGTKRDSAVLYFRG
jgi:penicillin-binding protein 1A